MNISEFLNLNHGDEIAQGAHVYRVIHKHAGVIVAQRTITLEVGDDWSKVERATAQSPPAVIVRPPVYQMREQLLAADFSLLTTKKDGEIWCDVAGHNFRTIEAAWDTLPPASPAQSVRLSNLESIREKLRQSGWERFPGGGVVWKHASGIKVRGTVRAFDVFKHGVPGRALMTSELRDGGYQEGQCGLWYDANIVLRGNLAVAYSHFKGYLR